MKISLKSNNILLLRSKLLILFGMLFILIFFGCRKIEIKNEIFSKKQNSVDAFLSLPIESDSLLVRITQEMRKLDQIKPFIQELATKAGNAKWEFSELQTQDHVSLTLSNEINSKVITSNTTQTTIKDSTVLIPFVKEGEKHVRSFLAIHISDSMRFDFFNGSLYSSFGYNNNGDKLSAIKIAKRCMLFDFKIFQIDSFIIKDKKLALAFSKGRDTTGIFVFQKKNNSSTLSVLKTNAAVAVAVTYCWPGVWLPDPYADWDTYTQDHPPLTEVGGGCATTWHHLNQDYSGGIGYSPDDYYFGGGGNNLGWETYNAHTQRVMMLHSLFNDYGLAPGDAEMEWLNGSQSSAANIISLIENRQTDETEDFAEFMQMNMQAAKFVLLEEAYVLNEGPYDENYAELILAPSLQIPSIIPITNYSLKLIQAYTINCAILRQQNPQWSSLKVRYEAARTVIQMGLDLVGTFPGPGTIANLLNASIYSIHGEGINATLSLVGAVPGAGWVTIGAKYAYVGKNLMFATAAGIKFVRNSDYFRAGLGLVKGDGLIGHHITPFVLKDHNLVQRAAQAGFHINDPWLNGKVVSSIQQPSNHPNYTNQVSALFDLFIASKGGIQNISPQVAKGEILRINAIIKNKITLNPNELLNNLTFP